MRVAAGLLNRFLFKNFDGGRHEIQNISSLVDSPFCVHIDFRPDSLGFADWEYRRVR